MISQCGGWCWHDIVWIPAGDSGPGTREGAHGCSEQMIGSGSYDLHRSVQHSRLGMISQCVMAGIRILRYPAGHAGPGMTQRVGTATPKEGGGKNYHFLVELVVELAPAHANPEASTSTSNTPRTSSIMGAELAHMRVEASMMLAVDQSKFIIRTQVRNSPGSISRLPGLPRSADKPLLSPARRGLRRVLEGPIR